MCGCFDLLYAAGREVSVRPRGSAVGEGAGRQEWREIPLLHQARQGESLSDLTANQHESWRVSVCTSVNPTVAGMDGLLLKFYNSTYYLKRKLYVLCTNYLLGKL